MKHSALVRTTLIALTLMTGGTLATAASFTIASQQMAESFAFDGTNYMVALVNYGGATRTVGGKRISPEGFQLGGFISTGRTGMAANIAFDSTNYLLVWEDDGMGTLNGNTNWQVYGQFIGTGGNKVGPPIAISTVGIQLDGIKTLSFGGGVYLMTYTRFPGNGTRHIAGRIIQPDGTLGNEFRISTGNGKAADVASNGSSFFVVWCEDDGDTEIRGRMVSTTGVLGTEFAVNSSGAPSDNPNSVIFNGQNYLVVWDDEVGGYESGEWDIYGQLVSPAGALVGNPFAIVTDTGRQLPLTLASDGTKHLLAWIDMTSFTDLNLYGTYIGLDGTVEEPRLILADGAGNQMGGVGFAGGNYMVLYNDGVTFDQDGNFNGVMVSRGFFIEGTKLIRLQLQMSTGLDSWTPLPVTPSMIGADGKLNLPVGDGAAFYRLGIEGGN